MNKNLYIFTLLILYVAGGGFTSAYGQYASVEPDDFFETTYSDESSQTENDWRYEAQEAGNNVIIASNADLEITRVTLKSPLGKVIRSYNVSPYDEDVDFALDTDGLAEGLYLVVTETATQVTSDVLVIK